jgi:hypothetical protein
MSMRTILALFMSMIKNCEVTYKGVFDFQLGLARWCATTVRWKLWAQITLFRSSLQSLFLSELSLLVIAFSTLSFNLLFKPFYSFVCLLCFELVFPHGHSFFMYFSISPFGYPYSHG